MQFGLELLYIAAFYFRCTLPQINDDSLVFERKAAESLRPFSRRLMMALLEVGEFLETSGCCCEGTHEAAIVSHTLRTCDYGDA